MFTIKAASSVEHGGGEKSNHPHPLNNHHQQQQQQPVVETLSELSSSSNNCCSTADSISVVVGTHTEALMTESSIASCHEYGSSFSSSHMDTALASANDDKHHDRTSKRPRSSASASATTLSLSASAPKRLGKKSSLEMTSITGQSVRSIVESARNTSRSAAAVARFGASGGAGMQSSSTAGRVGGQSNKDNDSFVGKTMTSNNSTGSSSSGSFVLRMSELKLGAAAAAHAGEDSLIGRSRERKLLLDVCKRVVVCSCHDEADKCGSGGERDSKAGCSSVPSGGTHMSPSSSCLRCSYPELVMVHGDSGTGKTALVQSALKSQTNKQEHFFLEGKFDDLCNPRAARPFAAIMDALSDFSMQLLADQDCGSSNANDIDKEHVRTAIVKAMGHDYSNLITSLIPNMASIFHDSNDAGIDATNNSRPSSSTVANGASAEEGETRKASGTSRRRTSTTPSSSSPEDLNRQMYMFLKFFRAIGSCSGRSRGCGRCRPVVLFLDDLQWADEASLQLFENLATDHSAPAAGNNAESSSTLLIVGTYRDNEVDENHSLSKRLEFIREHRSRAASTAPINTDNGVTDIVLGNLSRSHVNTLVSKALRSTDDVTKSLSDIVMSKTCGNPFFVTQFLLVLHSEGLLKFNLGTLKWQWDEEGIAAKQVSSNVSDLTKARLLGLTPKQQSVLTVAACLGNEFRKDYLVLAMGGSSDNDGHDVEDALQVAVVNGILRPVDGVSVYAFVHDQIQYAAFCLVPQEERAAIQCRAGISIIRNAFPDELVGDLLLIAVDLANCDPSSFTRLDDGYCRKSELAMLNLRAGRQSLRIAAYAIAASYFEAGVALLDEDSFTNDYRLILDLYTLAAQAHYCNGNVDRCNRYLDMVLVERPLPVEDRLPAYMLRLTVLYVTDQHNKGTPLTKKVFEELGYNGFPKKVSTIAIMKDFLKTKRLVKKHKENIPSLGLCQDKTRVTAMGILDVMAAICYFTDDPALPLIVFRILRWSIKYGLSSHSGTGFVMFGVILCTMGDLHGGFEFGQIATAVHKRLKREHGITTKRMYIVEALINHYTLPIQLRAKPCLDIYEDSMRAGDTEGAMWALYQSSVFGWFSSTNLHTLDEQIMKPHSQMIRDYKLIIVWRTLLPFRQTILNLSGRSLDPLVLTGEAMNQEDLLKTALEENNRSVINIINSLRMELAYLFGEYESAAKLVSTLLEPEICYPGFYHGIRQKFFEGLTCLAMARIGAERSSRRAAWMKRGLACIKVLAKLTRAGDVNTVHMLHLLNAEVASLRGHTKSAAENYDKAISTASRNGFVQDRALAHERCALFYLGHHHHRDDDWASHHMRESVKSYTYWGATRKVDYLSQTYPRLLVERRRRSGSVDSSQSISY